MKVAALTSASPAASKSNSRRNGPDVSPAARAARLLAELACTGSEQLKDFLKNCLGVQIDAPLIRKRLYMLYVDQVQVGSSMIAGGVCATTAVIFVIQKPQGLNLMKENRGTCSPSLDPGNDLEYLVPLTKKENGLNGEKMMKRTACYYMCCLSFTGFMFFERITL